MNEFFFQQFYFTGKETSMERLGFIQGHTHKSWRPEWYLPGDGGGNTGQEVQTSSYKMNMFQGPNVQNGD